MECNGEVSDTDSGIILHSGSDSPTTGGLKDVSSSTRTLKDVSTNTRAMKLRHQSLQERLELCVRELKTLCIREAELTGRLSPDYPLLPGEKPPQVRRRIGAAFKLDEQSIVQRGGGPEESQINSVDAELCLQTQIYEASRKLLQEENLHKNLKRSRLQQFRREERRLKELQDTSFQLRLQRGRNVALQHDQGHSDDSSLSDSVVLEEEAPSLPGPPNPSPSPLPVSSQNPTSPTSSPSSSSHTMPSCPVTPSPLTLTTTPCVTPSPLPLPLPQPLPQPLPRHTSQASLDSSQSFGSSSVGEGLYDAPPIQHTPWSESSLDQPYEKKKKSHRSSTASSPASPAQTLPPLEACLPVGVSVGGLTPAALPQKLSHLKLRHTVSNSTPCTPEMQVRRQLSLRLPNISHTEPSCYDQESRGRVRVPRRRLTEYAITLPPGSSPYGGGGGAITLPPGSSPYGGGGGGAITLPPGSSPYGGGGGGSHASEDSNSEHSSSTSYASSPCQDLPLPKQHHQHYASSPCQDLPPPSYHQPGPPFYSPTAAPLGMGGAPLGMGGATPPPPFPNTGGGFYQNARHQSSPSFHHRGGYYHGDEGYPPLDPMGGGYHPDMGAYPQREHPDMGGYSPLDHLDMARTYYAQQAPCPSRQHDYSPNYRYMETPVYHPSHPHSRPPPPRGEVRLARSPSLWDHQQHQYQTNTGPARQAVGEELCSWHQRSSFRGGGPRGGGGPPPRPRSLDRQGAVRVKNTVGAGRGSPLFTRRQQYQPEQMTQRRLQPQQRPVVVDQTPSVRCWAADDNSELFSQV